MKNLYWLCLSVLIIILDQSTKLIVAQHLYLGDSIQVTNFFNLVHAQNYGAAFSFMDHAGGGQRWVFSLISLLVSIFLSIWLLKLKSNEKWRACGLSLVLGGAFGNLWDRFMVGHVVDFLDFHVGNYHWPAFNVADSAVCVGAAILMFNLLSKKS